MDEHLDPLIDDVAKAMTAASADTDLARRVSMRIAETRERRTLWSRPLVLVPFASACVLLVAVFAGHEKPMPEAPYVERAFQARVNGGAPERVALRNPQTQIARLPEPQPTTIAPIQLDRLAVQPIVEMSAINVSAIDINPIPIDRIDISAMP